MYLTAKLQNLLVVSFRPWRIKIGDFGLCKQVLGDLTSLRTDAGTPLWAAPDFIQMSERGITPARLTSGHLASSSFICSPESAHF